MSEYRYRCPNCLRVNEGMPDPVYDGGCGYCKYGTLPAPPKKYKTIAEVAMEEGVSKSAVRKRLEARERQGKTEGMLIVKNGERTIRLVKVGYEHTVAAGPKTGRPRKEKS